MINQPKNEIDDYFNLYIYINSNIILQSYHHFL